MQSSNVEYGNPLKVQTNLGTDNKAYLPHVRVQVIKFNT